MQPRALYQALSQALRLWLYVLNQGTPVEPGPGKLSCPAALGQQLGWGWGLLAWAVGSGAWVEPLLEAWATDAMLECLEPQCRTPYNSTPLAASQDWLQQWLMMAPEATAMSRSSARAIQGCMASIDFS